MHDVESEVKTICIDAQGMQNGFSYFFALGKFIATMVGDKRLVLYGRMGSDRSKWNFKGGKKFKYPIQTFKFCEDADGHSLLFVYLFQGELKSIDLNHFNRETGILIAVNVFQKPVYEISFSNLLYDFSGPGIVFFRQSSYEILQKRLSSDRHHRSRHFFRLSKTTRDLEGRDGKLHVKSLDSGRHLFTHLSPLGEKSVQSFGFFQSGDVSLGSIMWYAASDQKIGMKKWPFVSPLSAPISQIVVPDGIQSVHICNDGERVVVQSTSGTIHLWRILSNALKESHFEKGIRSNYLDASILDQISKFFRLFQKKEGSKNEISLVQAEAVMCALGFYPSKAELENIQSEINFASDSTSEGRQLISLQNFISFFIRYRSEIDPKRIRTCFQALTKEEDEVFASEFMKKLETKGMSFEEELTQLKQTIIDDDEPLYNSLLQNDVLDVEKFLQWLQGENSL